MSNLSTKHTAVVETKETIFFSYRGDDLCQWILATIENASDAPVEGSVEIEAGGKRLTTALEIEPGVRDYRCYAVTLWPDHAPSLEAPLRLTVGGQTITTTTAVGSHRPWTIYLLSDMCTDYTWVYDNEAEPRAHDAAVTAAELELAERFRANNSDAHANRYNFVHAREVEFFLEHYPEKAETFFEHIRRGAFGFNPFFNMALTCDMSLEELIRQFYPARAWAMEHGLDMGYANHQETPTIAWSMATILAESGINHLVKAILPYECPWAKRLGEPPLFVWEGPDGSRVLLRRRNTDYVEGNFVLRDLRATTMALHDHIIPAYEQLDNQYPFNAIALLGCYGDLAPSSKDLPARKSATIAEYNAQEWDYPRLVDATHKEYWNDIEAQVQTRRIQVPVYRGDYGASWDAWPASLAHDFAGWRRAQERAGTADRLAALLYRLNPEWYEVHRDELARGWINLTYLADHAWNGASDVNRAFNASLRRRWQEDANVAFDSIIEAGFSALAQRVPSDEQDSILVFNGLAWARTGLVPVTGIQGPMLVIDRATGETAPTQLTKDSSGRQILSFEAQDVPSLGYKVFRLAPAGPQVDADADVWHVADNRLEGPMYSVEISPITGGIVSLYDKVRKQGLVDPESPYHLNQCLYWSEGVEHTPKAATVKPGARGPLFAELVVQAQLKNTRVTSTITLYASLDRVDIRNAVEKTPSCEQHQLEFAFPLRVPNRQYRFEAPGAIVTPGEEQRPGAGKAITAVRHFVDVFNDEFGVTLSQADSGLIQFGHRTALEDPLEPEPGNSTILALALGNAINYREVTHDQAGVSHFVFRYSLRGHAGGFDPVAAVRFGAEDNNELLSAALPRQQQGELPPEMHSFVRVSPDHVQLTALKVAEERGLIARLWECAGENAQARLRVDGLGAIQEGRRTDLLERNDAPLDVVDNEASVSIGARGLATVRLL